MISELNIGGYHPNSFIDYPGRVAAVIFFQGCNFCCPFCHNRQLISGHKSSAYAPGEILGRLQERKGKLGGVVLSGGEPTLQPNLSTLSFFCGLIQKMGYGVKLDTNGSQPEVIEALLKQQRIDYVAMDIKAPLAGYTELAGVRVRTENIVRSIKLISESGLPHHFRTTFDTTRLSQEDITQIRRLVPKGSGYIVQPCTA